MSRITKKLNQLKTRFTIRYQELFEGVGDQLIVRLTTPLKNDSSYNYKNYDSPPPPIENSTFKQLAGCVTLIYTILIAVLSVCLALAYYFFPEERLHHTNLIFLIIICALIFGICLVAFCIYARVYKVGGEIRGYSPTFGSGQAGGGGLDGMDSLGSVAYGRNVKINITHHPGNYSSRNNAGGFGKVVENIPSWDDDFSKMGSYTDVKEDIPDYDGIRKQQGVNRANLQFLKHID